MRETTTPIIFWYDWKEKSPFIFNQVKLLRLRSRDQYIKSFFFSFFSFCSSVIPYGKETVFSILN